jgi:thiamine-phosphate diphosphorylase
VSAIENPKLVLSPSLPVILSEAKDLNPPRINSANGSKIENRKSKIECPCLMLVTEPLEPARLLAVIRAAVAGGVDIVQLRDRTATPENLREQATVVKQFLPQTLVLINGGPGAACDARVDGVHLPEHGGEIARARQTVGAQRLVGRSVHSRESAQQAQKEGADYVVAGTIYASASHPNSAPAGLEFLRAVCGAVSLPVIAIGGITPDRAADCLRAGAAGVAVLSPIMHANDPCAAARQYRLALDAAWTELG